MSPSNAHGYWSDPEFAVAGNVYADIVLAADDLGDCVAEGLFECAFVDRFAGFMGTMCRDQLVGAG